MTKPSRREAISAIGAAILLPPALGRTAAAAAGAARWANVQALLDRYVAERRYAGVSAALAYGQSGHPVRSARSDPG